MPADKFIAIEGARSGDQHGGRKRPLPLGNRKSPGQLNSRIRIQIADFLFSVRIWLDRRLRSLAFEIRLLCGFENQTGLKARLGENALDRGVIVIHSGLRRSRGWSSIG